MSAPIKKQFDYYVTNLNWGDGTPMEYVSKPKLFDRSFNFEHNYERPGFYTITGLVFKYSLLLINAYPEAKEDMSQDFITYESTVTATDDDAYPAVQTQVRSIVQEEQYIRFAGFNISEDPQAVSGSASDGIQWSPSSLEAYKITKTDKSATNVSVYLGGAGNYGYETHGRSENEFLNSIQVKVGSSGNQANENTVPDLYNGLYVANHTRLSGARINVNVHMDPDNNSFFQYRFEAWLPNFGRRSDGLNLSDRDLENNPTRYAIKLRAIEPVYDEDGNEVFNTPDWSTGDDDYQYISGTNSWQTFQGNYFATNRKVRLFVDIRQRSVDEDYPPIPNDYPEDLYFNYGTPPWSFYIRKLEMKFQNNSDLLFPLEWERFRSKLIVNPKFNYESPLYEKNNFLLIGGLSKESFHFKTLASLMGYDIKTFNPRENFNFEKYNPYDVIGGLDTLAKYDRTLYNDYLDAYTEEVYSYGQLIHNGVVDKKWHGTFEKTELKQTDIGTIKVFKGVKPMWEQLGFENDEFDRPDRNFYWKNIHTGGLEERDGITKRNLPNPMKGALTPRVPREEFIVDEEASQEWNSDAYWPNLPKFNALGVLSDEYPPDKEPTLSYGSENGSIQFINDNDGDLLFELGFEDELNDMTDKSTVELNTDFKLLVDSNDRISKGAIDFRDSIETKIGRAF